jgi:hypothetical protein
MPPVKESSIKGEFLKRMAPVKESSSKGEFQQRRVPEVERSCNESLRLNVVSSEEYVFLIFI